MPASPPLSGAQPAADPGWGLQRLGIPACWQRGLSGAGVCVGHLDTGVDGQHPALRGRMAAFVVFDAEGFQLPAAAASDSGSHGTHTAGVICGTAHDQLQPGVAPGAELCSGMVIEGGKSLLRVLAGLDWLLDCQVRVVCLSLGLPGENPLFEVVLSRLASAGALVIAPVGNRGAGRACSPASYPGVLAVGATDANDRVAAFSASQQYLRATDYVKPNLVAPGVDIPSARAGGGVQTRSGTSMAAAHVAGVAALLFEAQPQATPAQVAEALLATCTPLAGSSELRCGRGLVNPPAALDALLGGRRSGR